MREKVYMAKSRIPGAGYGVHARKDLKAGELIETCPFIEVPYSIIYDRGNILQSYAFQSPNEGMVIVVFGLGSMYNHSLSSNVDYLVSSKDPSRLMDFVVSRDTPKGQELHINYGADRCKPDNPC
jgi:SET domain-containing protein